MSLSARRAWIEIEAPSSAPYAALVALRKESVDRNMRFLPISRGFSGSLSARRAWIEIEEVENYEEQTERRSPQGERG